MIVQMCCVAAALAAYGRRLEVGALLAGVALTLSTVVAPHHVMRRLLPLVMLSASMAIVGGVLLVVRAR